MARRTRDAEAELNLPPGFRFHPTDEELVVHYLCRKLTHQFLPVPIIAEVDLYKFDPWQLPEMALFGNKEWYFFTPRDRKYPNGSRPNRAAGSGYWKATGADKPVSPAGSSRPVGIKKALVFYAGKAPKGVKTNWIMHEYRLVDPNRAANKKGNLRLDDWVLCRLYNKKNNWESEIKQRRQAAEEASFGETTDSFETAEETASPYDSHRTSESDVDDDVPAEAHEQVQHSSAPLPAHAAPDLVRVKEDYDWYMDLNLDDLHNSFSTFAGAPSGTDMSSYQDYYYSGFGSPLLPRSSSQINLLPF